MDNEFTQKFAQEWISAWNNHDLDEILSHYADDFEMTSPVITQLANEPSGTLKGKQAVSGYWSRALQSHPDLHFEFLHAFAGVDSIIVHYRGLRGLAAEMFHFNQQGKVDKACAHYE